MKKLAQRVVFMLMLMLICVVMGIPLFFPYHPKADIDGPNKAEESRELGT